MWHCDESAARGAFEKVDLACERVTVSLCQRMAGSRALQESGGKKKIAEGLLKRN